MEASELAEALRVYYEDRAEDGQYSWADLREEIAQLTGIAIGPGQRVDAGRLRLFVNGVDGITPTPAEKTLEAIAAFLHQKGIAVDRT